MTWLAASILLLAVLGEPLLRRVLTGRTFVAAHLPGVPPLPQLRLPQVAVPVTSLLLAGAGAVLALLEVTAWAWLGLAVVAQAVPALVGLEAIRRHRVSARAKRNLARAVETYAPEFAVYAGRPEEASYQVEMWLPYLKRTGRKFIIITRGGGAGPDARGADRRARGLLQDGGRAGAGAGARRLTTVFYVNAASANGQMVRYSHLTHVHLGHGDSDKATSSNPLHAMYDKVFSAGPAAIQRYAANGVSIPRDRFCVVGRPQLEAVERATGPIGAVDVPTVLYAPTWRGHVEETRLYSLPVGERIVAALLARGVRVIFRAHPFNEDYPEDAADHRGDQRPAAGRRGRGPVGATSGGAGHPDDEHLRLLQRLGRDGLRRLQRRQRLPVLRQADRDVLRRRLAGGVRRRLPGRSRRLPPRPRPRRPRRSSWTGSWATDPLAGVRAEMRAFYLGDFPDEGYADVFVRAADEVIDGRGPPPRATSLEDLEDNDLPEDGGLGRPRTAASGRAAVREGGRARREDAQRRCGRPPSRHDFSRSGGGGPASGRSPAVSCWRPYRC